MQDLALTDIIKNIKHLSVNELQSLSGNIREKIIRIVEKNGGHLASNLGIVDTTVALYHVFDFPDDKLVFDVGHQCYAHKILSMRDGIDGLRTFGGLSGFPDRVESEYDICGAGHAGTSISTALGLCAARDMKGDLENVIVIVGDGAIGNGLNLEAITANTAKPKNFIVILNDNGMSISKNKNGLYQALSKRTIKNDYVKGKRAIKKIFGSSFITKFFIKIRDFVKRLINKSDYFDKFGFKYVGIVDGNNIKELVTILNRVKQTAKDKAVLLHIKTTKGKGLTVAENNSEEYHGVGKCFKTGSGTFAEALGKNLNEIIAQNKNVIAIVAGMKTGTGLNVVEKTFPKNCYDVGIAEDYAVTFAMGLAIGGFKPIVAIYSTFMQRAYDQIVNDVCMQNLPVIFCLDRSGFVGEDGKTHQGLFDLSYLSHIPNLTIIAPNGEKELKSALFYALSISSPVVIRYPKDCGTDAETDIKDKPSVVIKDSADYDITIIAVGPRMKSLAMNCAMDDNKIRVVSARIVKPLDVDFLDTVKENSIVATLEENAVIGGFGAMVDEYLSYKNIRTVNFGAPDKFILHGSVSCQFEDSLLTVENIKEKLNVLRCKII